MDKKEKKKNKIPFRKRIPRIIFLTGYVICAVTLIVEACIPGKQSAAQSASVSQAISSIIDGIYGDQAKFIEPTGCSLLSDKYEYHVGDRASLTIKTIPENSSYQSYTYKPSDDSMTNINSDGTVEFLKEGEVTITVTNNRNKKVKDSKKFTVTEIRPTKITSTINADKEGDTYILQTDKTYIVTNTFKPDNVTDKAVTYTFSNNASRFISMEEDTISVHNHSGSEVFYIYANTSNGLKSTLKCKSKDYEFVEPTVDLTGYKVTNYTKYVDQTSAFKPSITPIPSNATYPAYTLESLDTALATITSDNKVKITGNAIGTATIKVHSTYYPTITNQFTVTIKDRDPLTDISINLAESVSLFVDNVTSITVTPIPSNALIKSKTFNSSNTSVATITSAGKITALSAGSTTITVTAKGSNNQSFSKYINLTVLDQPEDAIDDITLDEVEGGVAYLTYKEKIDLRDYFSIESFLHKGDPISTTKTDYSYIFTSSQVKVENKYFVTPLISGEIKGYLQYINEQNIVIQKEITIYSIYEYTYAYEEHENASSSYIFDIYSSYVFNIIDNSNIDEISLSHSYKAISSDEGIISVTNVDNGFYLTALDAGEVNITIIPIYNDQELNYPHLIKTFTVNIKHIYLSSLIVNFTDSLGNVNVRDSDAPLMMYMSTTLEMSPIVGDKVTKTDFVYKVLDASYGSIKNNVFTPKKIGEVTVSIKDKASNIEKNFVIQIRNIIEFNDVYLTGKFTVDKSGLITIVNGESARIVPKFSLKTTYKKVTYTSSDENIATVASDGTITTKKAGRITVNAKCYDGYNSVEYNLSINVRRKKFTEDIQDFMLLVRKIVGHYGAFLILGIFSTFTYYLYLKDKFAGLGIFVNFSAGFLLASFTEFLQTLTPKRAGLFADVVIDYVGFLTSAMVITLILMIITVIIHYVRKYKKDKEQK